MCYKITLDDGETSWGTGEYTYTQRLPIGTVALPFQIALVHDGKYRGAITTEG